MSETMIAAAPSTHLVFETDNASLSQCDNSSSFNLRFFEEELNFKVCEFYAFKRKIQQLDLQQLLETDTPDIELIYLPHCDRMMVLTIQEILELRDLLSGSFTMLELNSLIHRQLVRKTF